MAQLPPELSIALAALQRLYDERPGVLLAILRFLHEPPDCAEITIRIRDGRLAGAQTSESHR